MLCVSSCSVPCINGNPSLRMAGTSDLIVCSEYDRMGCMLGWERQADYLPTIKCVLSWQQVRGDSCNGEKTDSASCDGRVHKITFSLCAVIEGKC
jgi:hypothetical protein